MTARSKGKRVKNARIKREKNKAKELKRLQKIVNGGQELMNICGEIVDEKKINEIKQKQLEEKIEEEFIAEKREKIESISKKKKKKKIKCVNSNTGLVHEFDPKTLKDQYGSYPPWLHVANHKKKINKNKRRKVHKLNQFMGNYEM